MEDTRNNQARVIPEIAASPLAIATSFTFLALMVRLYFVLGHSGFDNIFSVKGVPYSDGFTWVSAAVRCAQGYGLGSVYRPGFSILLALFYVWFGYSGIFISISQTVIGALTAGLVYLIGARIFNRSVACIAALFFVFDPSQLTQTPQATTEPLGLLFFLVAIYLLLQNREKGSWNLILMAGVALGLSNLTRPLTLFCVPFYAGQLMFDHWRRSGRVRFVFLPAAVFCAGLILTMSPWLIRQRMTHGVWAVSTNLGEALYGATSPKYGTWTSLVRVDADRAGVAPDLGSRYRFFIAESLKNIRQHPSFYLRKVASSFWSFLNCFHPAVRARASEFSFPQWSGLVEGQTLFIVLLSSFLFVAGLTPWLMNDEPLRSVIFVTFSMIVIGIWLLIPVIGFVVLAIGLGMALRRSSSGATILGWSLVGAGLGDALFNNAILYRAVLMTDWLYSLLYLFAFTTVIGAATKDVLHRFGKQNADQEFRSIGNQHSTAVPRKLLYVWRVGAMVFAVFFIFGALRLAIANYVTPPKERVNISDLDKKELVQHLRSGSVALSRALPDPTTYPITFVTPQAGRMEDALVKRRHDAQTAIIPFSERHELIVAEEVLLPIVYYLPKGSEFEARDRIFHRRPFDVSILRTARALTVFPGKLSSFVTSGPAVLVGWIEGEHPGGSWLGQVVQCVAIVPVKPNGQLDYKHAATCEPRIGGIL